MPLLKLSHSRVTEVSETPWIVLEDDAPALDDAPVLVSLQRWLDADAAPRSQGVGVLLQPADDPELLRDRMEGLDLIAVNFPRFADGRGYSTAHLLRTRLGWRGELRALGDVLPDQLAFMARCGFDAFEVRSQHVAPAQDALQSMSVLYQTAADRVAPIWRRRTAEASPVAAE